MTRSDIVHLIQVGHSLKSKLLSDEMDLYIDRLLWAIRASNENPKFDEQQFRQAAKGEFSFEIFEKKR